MFLFLRTLYVFFTIVKLNDYKYPEHFYNTTFMYYYSWNFTYVVFVILNSSINPIVYLCRMKTFRTYLTDLFRTRRTRVGTCG